MPKYLLSIKPWMEPKPGSDEAPKDPGVLGTHHSYNDQDFDGHRQHAMYVGFHVPGGYRRRGHHHRRHHRHHHRNGTKKEGEEGENRPVTPPSERVHFILGEDDQDGQHSSHPLFSELEELVCTGEDGEMEWRERARWIKFEEDVEEGGDRWSKPHVATISLHSLFELRSCILNGTVMLDLEASSLDQIADLVLENMVNVGQLRLDLRDRVKENLLRRHRHQHEKKHDKGHKDKSHLPNIRSLVEIGRNSSRSMFGSHRSLDKLSNAGSRPGSRAGSPFASPAGTSGSRKPSTVSQSPQIPMTAPPTLLDWRPSFSKYLGLGHEDTDVQHGGNEGGGGGGHLPQSNSATSLNHLAVMGAPHHQNSGSSFGDVSSSTDLQHKANQAFMRKIPPGSEADNILVGELDFLDRTISAFVRLSVACHLGDLTEVPVPTRFLFILLGPRSIPGRYHEIGRSMATLMSDEVFHEIAYKAKNRQDLLAGVDEFLDAVTILPPGAWDPSIRIEPPQKVPSQESRKRDPHHPPEEKQEVDSEEEEERERERSGLVRSGKLFGGLINDIKRKAPWYWSDFKDAIALQSLASVFFLYFACLAPIITFGGLLGQATGQNIATMESLLTGAICGIMYGLFSGQPLTILGSTGPVLVFETIVFDFCQRYDFNYLAVRMWIGLWMAGILFVFVALDASSLVCYITRFTEENFATLISVIFIYKAVENVLLIGKTSPIRTKHSPSDYTCSCKDDFTTTLLTTSHRNESLYQSCLARGGELIGPGCHVPQYVPDVFLFSFILFLFTYVISVVLKDFKTASFFPAKVRAVISDFAVVIAIFTMTFIDYITGIATPKLIVPQEFKPTSPHRDWLFNPFPSKNPWWTPIIMVIPATLATILIFMDQQITAVIVNRKENKLKKGCGYHLDLLIVAILIVICSIIGLPWFVAATVLSMTHVNSLRMESECAAPGEKPQFLGVREQRVTHVIIFVLVGVSVFLTNYLKHIPMPVLFGVFLYMGTSSLKGSQMFARILILFMPQKYQPDYIFLRQVRIERVHLFTAIQLLCFALLWIIKSYKPTSIAFPVMLVVIIGVRKLLDFVFTQRELKILDDVMPEHTRRAIEEKKKKDEDEEKDKDIEGQSTDPPIHPSGSSGNVAIPLANGNILKIPVDKFSTTDAETAQQLTINISEQLTKSSAWKTIEQKNSVSKPGATSTTSTLSTATAKKSKNRSNGSKDALTVDEQKRLSTMNEDEEDDCGITIRIDGPTPVPSNLPSAHTSPTEENNGRKSETPV